MPKAPGRLGPLAPARFPTTTGWPAAGHIPPATTWAAMSVAGTGAKGTTARTGWPDQVWAPAAGSRDAAGRTAGRAPAVHGLSLPNAAR